MENIFITFQYTPEEYSEAMRLHYENILNLKRDFYIGGGLFLLGIADLALFGYSMLWAMVVGLSVFFLLMLIFAYFVVPNLVFKRDNKLHDKYTLEFADEGINFKTVNLNSRLEWKIYNKVVEGEKFFLLYWGKYTFTVIPKRAFANESDQQKFRELIIERIKVAVPRGEPK